MTVLEIILTILVFVLFIVVLILGLGSEGKYGLGKVVDKSFIIRRDHEVPSITHTSYFVHVIINRDGSTSAHKVEVDEDLFHHVNNGDKMAIQV